MKGFLVVGLMAVLALAPTAEARPYLHRADALRAGERYVQGALVDFGASSGRLYDCHRASVRAWMCSADYNDAVLDSDPGVWTVSERVHIVIHRSGAITARGTLG